ncbi:MAG: TRAP transporter large permease subunit, partial [Alphaproteobacteria bacterium]|nr:TRAP transporter large permease subunit [Alphaproteobacteria bacterium]
VVLTWALLAGYTPTMVAVFGSIAVIAVSMLKADTRLTPVRMWVAFADATTRVVAVAGATAAAGLVIGGITMTGLAAKFAHLVYALTAADQLLTVLVAAGLTILLGMGMPTPSAYILAAVLMGPLMKQTGFADLPAHMFLLYFAVLSAITPPVAVAAFAASSISGENPMHIAVQAVKFALAAFLVPFVFIFGPELLLGSGSPLWKTAITFGTAAIGLVFLSAAVESYDKWTCSTLTRIMLGTGAIFLVMPPYWSIAIGVVLCGGALAITRMRPASAIRPPAS